LLFIKGMEQYYQTAMEDFKKYFERDLVGWIKTPKRSLPRFKTVVAGGYGLNTILGSKYELKDKIKTKDLDITISTHNSKMSFHDCFTYWILKINKFIQSHKRPFDFKMTIINTGKHALPVLDYNRFAIISLLFKGQDFVDLVFTDQGICKSHIDIKHSIIDGLPLKRLDEYLKELMTLIYMENISYIYPDLYDKRNPVDGWYKEKGIQDIARANIVCSLIKDRKYSKYCRLIEEASIEKLNTMHWKKRDEYFKALESLVILKSFIMKDVVITEESLEKEHKNVA
jgi:hypothetical protein